MSLVLTHKGWYAIKQKNHSTHCYIVIMMEEATTLGYNNMSFYSFERGQISVVWERQTNGQREIKTNYDIDP